TLNTTKWNILANGVPVTSPVYEGTYSVQASNTSAGNNNLKSNYNLLNINMSIDFVFYDNGFTATTTNLWSGFIDTAGGFEGVGIYGGSYTTYYYNYGTTYASLGVSRSTGWHRGSVKRFGSTLIFEVDGVSTSVTYSNTFNYITFYSKQGTGWWDIIRVRRYTSSEPTTSIGAEQILVTLTISPNPAPYTKTITITATCTTGDTCGIYYPNLATPLVTNITKAVYIIPGNWWIGTYSYFYAYDSNYAINSSPTTLTITPFNFSTTQTTYNNRLILNFTTFVQNNFSSINTNNTITFTYILTKTNYQNTTTLTTTNVAQSLIYVPNTETNIIINNLQIQTSRLPSTRFLTVTNTFCPLLIQSVPAKISAGIIDTSTAYANSYTIQIFNQSTNQIANLNNYYFVTLLNNKQVQIWKITAIPFGENLLNSQLYSFQLLDPSCNLVYTSPSNIWTNPINLYVTIGNTNKTFANPYIWLSKVNYKCNVNSNYTTNKSSITCSFSSPSSLFWNLTAFNKSKFSYPIIYSTSTITTSGTLQLNLTNINAYQSDVYFYATFNNTKVLLWSTSVGYPQPMFASVGYFIALIFVVLVAIGGSLININLGVLLSIIVLYLFDYLNIISLGLGKIYLLVAAVILLVLINKGMREWR
ncbi:MAG: hypothetical protein ACP5HJ_03600, partial [Candidatus Micrarchaeia archaeon]